MLSTWPALVFILPKQLDNRKRLYYNVEVVLRKVMNMTGLEILGILIIYNMLTTGEPMMTCVSGCF